MFKDYQAVEILIHSNLRTEVHAQMVTFNPMKLDNSDDILDLLCYAPRVQAEFGEYVVSIGEIRELEHSDVDVDDDNCCY